MLAPDCYYSIFKYRSPNYNESADLAENGVKMTIFALYLQSTQKRIFFYSASPNYAKSADLSEKGLRFFCC